jgi:hypothetical protein
MANIIDTLTGDRCLQLSGSEAFYRSIDIPSGSSDIRFGMMLSTTGSGISPGQTFSPTVSVYETMLFGFTNSTGSIPTVTPGVTYLTLRNAAVGESSQLYNGTLLNGSDRSGSMVGGQSLSTFATGSFPTISNSITMGATSANMSFGINGVTSKPLGYVIRIYKNSTNQIIIEGRSKSSYDIASPMNFGTAPTYTTSQAEDYLRSILTDLSQITLITTRTFTFTNQTDRDNAFSLFNTVFFGWPFYTAPLNIHCMAYRAI